MKLLLFISRSGTLSRRKAFESIRSGFVAVNGKMVQEPSCEVDPLKDQVSVKGRLINGRRFEYVLMNKPAGYVTTCEGQFDQRTVIDLLPKSLKHLRPVGRLDKETEGLLLLTNDGILAQHLMHPSFNIEKKYLAKVRWFFTPQSVEKLERGVVVFGQKTAPAKVTILSSADKESEIEIIIHEGKKRQVRLMLDAVGHPVVYLQRLQQGPLLLGTILTGQWRHLTQEELSELRRIQQPVKKKENKPMQQERKKRIFKHKIKK